MRPLMLGVILQHASSCSVTLQVAHRKFMDGMWDRDIQPKLCAEIPKPAYRLSIRYDVPGMFFLGFVLRKTPSRENFSVLPSGYYFRKQVSWINQQQPELFAHCSHKVQQLQTLVSRTPLTVSMNCHASFDWSCLIACVYCHNAGESSHAITAENHMPHCVW